MTESSTRLTLVPLINYLIYYRCLVYPEDCEDSKSMDRIGKINTRILLALFVLVLIALVIIRLTVVNTVV